MPTNGHLTVSITSDTMRLMRVVLDTNVLVSGLRSRDGASFKLLSRIGTGRFESVVSVPLAVEYEAALTLQAQELGLTIKEIAAFVDNVCEASTQHEVFFLWRPALRDPRDEFLLELAIAARCHAIVTHNVRDLAGARAHSIAVLTPAEFSKKVKDQS